MAIVKATITPSPTSPTVNRLPIVMLATKRAVKFVQNRAPHLSVTVTDLDPAGSSASPSVRVRPFGSYALLKELYRLGIIPEEDNDRVYYTLHPMMPVPDDADLGDDLAKGDSKAVSA